MALKLVTVISEVCVRCGGATGPEVIPGDTVQLYLDQATIPAFPEWIEGTIISVTPQTESSTGPKEYIVQYEADDLDGSAAAVRDCDVLSVICEGCCVIINDYLTLMAGVNFPHVQLSYEWFEDGTFALHADAFSNQIAGVPGSQVSIDTYTFYNPASAVIPEVDSETDRVVTPADVGDADWAGGFYTVQVTDSEGLSNTARVWVAPRPRFRRETLTLLNGQTTVSTGMAVGEEIVSITATRSDGGFYQFAPTLADPSVIEASAAPSDGNLDLIVLFHIP